MTEYFESTPFSPSGTTVPYSSEIARTVEVAAAAMVADPANYQPSPREKRMTDWIDKLQGKGKPGLPRYQCHKLVHAVKIKGLQTLTTDNGRTTTHSIIPYEAGVSPFEVSREYILKHKPEPDGYWVLYDDGYQSYSPAEAFEAGYSLAESIPDRLTAIAEELTTLTQLRTKELSNIAVVKALDTAANMIRATALELS